MKTRSLGRSKINVSELGFGCWPIGGGWGGQDDESDIASLQLALEQGVTFFDTAMAYGDGHSEEVLGKAFANVRDQVTLATKISPKADPDGPVGEAYPASWIIECTEQSLKRLGAERIDLQQIHCWRDHYTDSDEWYEAATRLKEQGKIRAFGVSAGDWDHEGGLRLIESGRTDSVQIIYNLFDQQPTERLFPAALKNNVGIIVRVSLFEGLLGGKIRPGHSFGEGDWRAEFLTPERLNEVAPRLDALEQLTTAEYPTLASLALKFCLSHPAVSTVIAGMRNPKHVEANCAISEASPLSPDLLAELKKHAWNHNWAYPWDKRAK
jgi:aryl-alcohol dehydrogenase-like predicted oxidoreductase